MDTPRQGSTYVKDTDLVTRDIAGETIVVPIRGRVGDLDAIYTMNEVGALIWKLIDGKKQVDQIVEAVSEAFEVSEGEARKDALEFLRSLEEAGLIRPQGDEECPAKRGP